MTSRHRSRSPAAVPDRLHSLAIHLLRKLRSSDAESELSPARLSALSVLVFRGRVPLGELAAIEGVTAPTMTRLVQGLEKDGLVSRRPDRTDGRVVLLGATAKGSRLMNKARAKRVAALEKMLSQLTRSEISAVEAAIAALEPVVAR